MFPGQCGNTAFFFKSQPDQFHFEFRGIVFPGKSFFSAHEVSTCKISGCLSYRILDSGPDGTQTTLTLIEEGILREDEEISPCAARERWYRQKTLDALRFRRQRGAERKRANRLARYSRERQIHEMSLHILKTMPADEAYWCTTERLQQLAIQNLYQLELALAPPS
ncbi:hypothetical protein C2767_30540 (plasmid) [Klebsiella quasipneumoniae]|nr:hypothetical protein C2767_30540 [Klebsiella quasipneumoniae]